MSSDGGVAAYVRQSWRPADGAAAARIPFYHAADAVLQYPRPRPFADTGSHQQWQRGGFGFVHSVYGRQDLWVSYDGEERVNSLTAP